MINLLDAVQFMWILVLQRLTLEVLLDLLYFPIWWYSGGARHAFLSSWHWLLIGNRHLAPGLWARNIFVPMYGQYDWQGRIVSFFMRLFQLLLRSVALIFWLGVCILSFILWLFLPIGVVIGMMYFH